MFMIGSLDLLEKKDQKRLITQARNYEEGELQKFIDDTGWEDWMEEFVEDSEEPTEEEIERINKVLEEAFNKAQEEIPMARQLRDLAKMKRVDFCEKYGIPLRTMEDWDAGKSKAPQYVMDLLERAVRQDLGLQSIYYVYKIGDHDEVVVYMGYNINEARRFARSMNEDGDVEIRRYHENIEDEDCNNWDYDTIDF